MELGKYCLPGDGELYVGNTDKFKTISIDIQLHCGRDDTTSNALLPYVLKRGSGKFPTEIIWRRSLARLYGSKFGVMVDKIGWEQLIRFYLDVISRRYMTGGDVLSKALTVVVDIILNPSLANGAFNKKYVSEEMAQHSLRQTQMLNLPIFYARFRCLQETVGDDYVFPKYGRAEELYAITPATLYSRYKEILKQSRVVVFCIGEVDVDEITGLLEEKLRISREMPDRKEYQKWQASQRGNVRRIRETGAVAQMNLCVAYSSGIGRGDNDYWALAMVNEILGYGRYARMFRAIREEAGLAYYAHSVLEPLPGVILIESGIEPGKEERVLGIIEREVDNIRKGRFSDEEINCARRYLLGRLLEKEDDPRLIIDAYTEGIIGGVNETLEESMMRVEAVSRMDIERAVRRIRLETVYTLAPRRGSRYGA